MPDPYSLKFINLDTAREIVARLQSLRDECESAGDDGAALLLSQMIRLGVILVARWTGFEKAAQASHAVHNPSPKDDTRLAIAKVAGTGSAMIALPLPGDAARTLLDLIAQSDGLPAGTEHTLPEDLHLTLAFLGDAAQVDAEKALAAVKAFAAEHAPVQGQISGLARLSSANGKVPLVALVDAETLPSFQQNLLEQLAAAGIAVNTEHSFTPHITLAYLPENATAEIAVSAEGVQFAEIALVIDELWTRVPLTGKANANPSSQDQNPLASVYGGLIEKRGALSIYRVNGERIRAMKTGDQ